MSAVASTLDALSGALDEVKALVDELGDNGCVVDPSIHQQLERVRGAARALRRSVEVQPQ